MLFLTEDVMKVVVVAIQNVFLFKNTLKYIFFILKKLFLTLAH
jgi:hypothetical protein